MRQETCYSLEAWKAGMLVVDPPNITLSLEKDDMNVILGFNTGTSHSVIPSHKTRTVRSKGYGANWNISCRCLLSHVDNQLYVE